MLGCKRKYSFTVHNDKTKKKLVQTCIAGFPPPKPISLPTLQPIFKIHPIPSLVASCIRYKDGDLLNSNDSLIHCVSSDMRMGRGIAVFFKQKFKRIDELLGQQVRPGGCAVLEDSNRVIYYLVTKQRCYEKPTYDFLESSLCAARNHCEENNITSVSMPRIGCGLDGLNWSRVSKLIESVFGASNIKITVYILKAKH